MDGDDSSLSVHAMHYVPVISRTALPHTGTCKMDDAALLHVPKKTNVDLTDSSGLQKQITGSTQNPYEGAWNCAFGGFNEESSTSNNSGRLLGGFYNCAMSTGMTGFIDGDGWKYGMAGFNNIYAGSFSELLKTASAGTMQFDMDGTVHFDNHHNTQGGNDDGYFAHNGNANQSADDGYLGGEGFNDGQYSDLSPVSMNDGGNDEEGPVNGYFTDSGNDDQVPNAELGYEAA